ncbi:DUF1152 domain-containing protein [Streptomyces sp. Tue6028]|uniref:DUF1152 domain-containing protein n=1 Tax=Streptomyces sp. Tue6028 TaxID=2036037 RepID=UPI003D70E913
MTRLIVAAGGGGDAVAAAMLDGALHGDGDRTVILTYAWDRLLSDAVPGPRGPDRFTGLERLTPAVRTVPGGARPIAPAGSTLPRLAAALPQTFALIDPDHGAEGITRQVEELISHLAPDSIDLLDVGGDILARGDEPTLQSPLADALTLAACSQVNASVRLLVAGPGLDGELPPDELRGLLGPVVHTFTAEDVEAVGTVLEWHPSEAAAMLAATARGVRGVCEAAGGGRAVPLTDEGPTVHEADLDAALARSRLGSAIMETETLREVEASSREICGFSEIDRERESAARRGEEPAEELDARALLGRLDRFEARARDRGVTHATFGRLAEVLGLGGARHDELRRLLAEERPGRYAPPLWPLAS